MADDQEVKEQQDSQNRPDAKFAVGDRVGVNMNGKPTRPVRVVLEMTWSEMGGGWVYKTQEEGKSKSPIMPFPEMMLANFDPEPPPVYGRVVVSRPH